IDADDLERHCLDQQCAANEICGGLPELLRHIAADHHNTPPRPAVLPRQHPARLQGVTVDLGMLRRRADHVRLRFRLPSLICCLLCCSGTTATRVPPWSARARASSMVSSCWSRATPCANRMPVVTVITFAPSAASCSSTARCAP